MIQAKINGCCCGHTCTGCESSSGPNEITAAIPALGLVGVSAFCTSLDLSDVIALLISGESTECLWEANITAPDHGVCHTTVVLDIAIYQDPMDDLYKVQIILDISCGCPTGSGDPGIEFIWRTDGVEDLIDCDFDDFEVPFVSENNSHGTSAASEFNCLCHLPAVPTPPGSIFLTKHA